VYQKTTYLQGGRFALLPVKNIKKQEFAHFTYTAYRLVAKHGDDIRYICPLEEMARHGREFPPIV
jgi:hypothetical protein